MMADLRILQAQTQEMQNALTQLSQALAEAVKALSARVSDQTDATRKSFADQKIVIDALVNDLRVVRERVDDNNVRVGTLAQEVDALRDVITSVAARSAVPPADPALAGNAAPGSPVSDIPSPSQPSAADIGTTPQKLWSSAMAEYYSGNYTLAIQGFETYAKTFPRYEQADDALVYIGHSHFQDGKYERAVEAYDMAIRTYPTSNLLPEAYFRKGESLYNLKDTAGARAAWEFLLKTFPASDAAINAQQRIQVLPAQR
jgi:TolA-binding protein